MKTHSGYIKLSLSNLFGTGSTEKCADKYSCGVSRYKYVELKEVRLQEDRIYLQRFTGSGIIE